MPEFLRELPKPVEVRMVAVDLDGTLLDTAKNVCTQAAGALTELSQSGVKVVIASARPPRSVRHIYRELGLTTWQINYNGALIWDEPAGKVVAHYPLEGELVLDLIRRARATFPDLLATCEILDRWHTDRVDPAFQTETAKLYPPDVIAPIEKFCDRPVTKLIFQGDPSRMTKVAEIFSQQPNISMTQSDADILQIMAAGIDKGRAVAQVASNYGVPMRNVLAIGDAPNDIAMLRAAGIGVAVGNAPPAVQAAAHWVAPSNIDAGVYAALSRFCSGVR